MLLESSGVVGEGADRIGRFDQHLSIGIDREGGPPEQHALLGGWTIDGGDPATTGQGVGDQDRAPSMPGGRF